jgi:hypothetical protein
MGILAVAGFAAMLALGPWLLLQPILLSILGVVLTLYVLECPRLLEGVRAERARGRRWLLVPLFALWANLDGWYVLGPVLVGLYALGELLRRLTASGRGVHPNDFRTLGLLTLAGLAACLATPYHYHIFAWPTPLGLTATEQALRFDPLGQTLVLSPFGARFTASPVFRSPGAWAYYFLLATSAASFLLVLRTLHQGRLLVWLFLAALSIYQARTIPFFAVAAAPFLALNVREWLHRRPFSETRQRLRFAAVGVELLLGMLLLVLAWPGWMQTAPYQPRGWSVEPDGSLVRLAEHLKRCHAESRFRPDRFAFTFSPEVAHYLAWFCPMEKGFLDSRWPLFDRVAEDYVLMRDCLLERRSVADAFVFTSLIEDHHVHRILLHDTDWERMARVYRYLFRTPEWELSAVEGGATLFVRRDGTVSSQEAFDIRRAAYHVPRDQSAPSAPRSPRQPSWFDAFRRLPDSGSAGREEAALYLLTFDLQAEQQQSRLIRQWLVAQAAGLIGCGWATEPAGAAGTLALRLDLTPLLLSATPEPSAGQPQDPAAAEQFAAMFLTARGGGPPEPLFLAVRAARRALILNPDDARAFLLLGETYLRLARQTREPSWRAMLPDLAAVRQAQILTALEQAVLLRPDLDRAHALLAQLYWEEGQMDRRLDHLRARLRIAEQADKHSSAADAFRAEVEKMDALVGQSEKTYQANLAGKTDPSKVLDRAQLAARFGLSHKALQMLQESTPAIFGRAGVEYQLDLMMQAGQSYEVRDLLEPEHEFKITFATYHWIQARTAASCGDYAGADAELDRGSEPMRRIGLSSKLIVPVRSAVAYHVARAVLGRPPEAEGASGWATALRFQYKGLDFLGPTAELMRQEADRQVLRGLVAVESGAVETARRHFRAALDVWGSDAATAAGAGVDFRARPIAQEMLRRMEE